MTLFYCAMVALAISFFIDSLLFPSFDSLMRPLEADKLFFILFGLLTTVFYVLCQAYALYMELVGFS